ncbi:hypothetical protein E2562_001142 [Oryza meyeriana var. granulata]|uniref:Uncharacterized protein n=1 Tax=Oryza meyeriana var. granulata TaxID=110450 RepID=A0A6G1EFN1_9ORYZ|nr:hypothetical protein E2562_001142 [Oryza meyeriana var. granulata]
MTTRCPRRTTYQTPYQTDPETDPDGHLLHPPEYLLLSNTVDDFHGRVTSVIAGIRALGDRTVDELAIVRSFSDVKDGEHLLLTCIQWETLAKEKKGGEGSSSGVKKNRDHGSGHGKAGGNHNNDDDDASDDSDNSERKHG